jgi:hypothetical protein
MISGQKYIKTEFSTIVDEPMNGEEITYYPTWFNTNKPTTTGMYAEEKLNEKKFVRSTVEDIVISGVAGRFPVVEKTTKFWSPRQYSEEFLQGEVEPTMMSLMDVTLECLVDAGMDVTELKGLRTGVFIGMNKWETMEEERMFGKQSWMSTGKSVLAERLSKALRLTGPKVTIETEQSSSLYVLDKAINAIKLGLCDVAIVGGVKVGETVGVVLLQKRSTMPRRFYAKVLHTKYSEEPITEEYQNIIGQIKTRVMKEIYAENGIDTPVIKCGIPMFVGINKPIVEETGIFNLVKMLLSIKRGIIPSNLKYQQPEFVAERSLLKLVNKNTKFFGGLMALNSMVNLKSGRFLNTHILLQPNTDIVMSQCEESEKFWNREDLTELSRQPRLFQFSARTKQELEEVLEHMNRKPTDLALHFLLHPEYLNTPVTHPFRGFTVLNGQEPIIKKIVELEQETKRPIWFILSGLSGSIKGEWKQMAKELMKVDIFRQSIIKSTEHLKPYGINLVELIYGQYPVNNTWTTVVATTAVQIALIDCLKVAGIKHDGLIAHSLGELLCAYVEKALTAEETILTAYHFGKYINEHEAKFPLYTMAIVKGKSWEELKHICPVGVVPIVFNGVENIILSGPKYELIQFVNQLKYSGLFAKELSTTFSHLPIHTELMKTIAQKLKVVLEEEVIRSPRVLRSEKWIHTTMPVHLWERECAKYFSVDSLINSLINPVLFQEGRKYLPTDAICIEISPKSLLKTILKETTWTRQYPEMSYVPLMKLKNYKMETPIVTGGYLEHFWYVFGKLHLKGVNVDSVKLFVPRRHLHTVYPVPETMVPSWVVEREQQKIEELNEFLEEQELIGENQFTRKYNGEPKFARKYFEQPKYINEEFTCKYNEQPKYFEKETRQFFEQPKFLEEEFARQMFVQEPKFIQTEMYNQEPKYVQNEFARKYEQKMFNHSTPVVFNYPIDLTSTLFETELVGHKVDGRVVYPTSGYLYMVWKSLAKMQGMKNVEQLPILFEKVEFHRPTIMTIRGTPVKPVLNFQVRIVPTTGLFEIVEEGILIATGRVSIPSQKRFQTIPLMTQSGFEFLRREEIYDELKLKGYQYEGEFKPIVKLDLNAKYADMLWTGKWVPFLEGMIQMKAFAKRSTGGVMIPRRINSLFIDPKVHMEIVEKKIMNEFYMPKQTVIVPVVYDRFTKKTVAGGIEIVGIKSTFVPTFEKVEREFFNVERRTPFNTIPKVIQQEESIIEEEILEQIKREYVEFYLRECKRYAEFILKRIEYPTSIKMVRQFVPTTLPMTLKHLIEKIRCEEKYVKHQHIVASLLEGGDFLRFLKNVVEQIEQNKEESILLKLQLLFNENMFFYKALEKDTILSLVNMKSYFFDFFKTILEQEKSEECNMWNLESRIRKPEQFGLWNMESNIRKPFVESRIPFIPSKALFSKYL